MGTRQTSRSGAGRPAALAAALAILAVSPRTLADPKLQVLGEEYLGYTDNIESSPNVPIPGTSPKAPGPFLLLGASAVLASASARAIHRLKYTYTYDVFFGETSANTSSNQLEYQGFFDLSPRVSLLVGGSAVQSNQYAAMTLSPPGAGAVNATPAGSGAFLSASANELMSVDLGPDVRGYEATTVTEQVPIFGTVAPQTFVAAGRIGFERSFEENALGAEARAEYSVVEGSIATDGTPLGVQDQLILTGVGVWRHDWSRYFTSRVEAGALRLDRFNTGSGLWAPAGRASLHYATERGDAELTYAHAATTNPLLGQTLLYDEVRLRGTVPLTRKGELFVSGSAGYQAGQLLDEYANLAAHVDYILADCGLGWRVIDTLSLELRYQHIQQISDVDVLPLPYSFARNAVMLGAVIRFPSERDMPRAYRPPQRVDGTDEIRDGMDPAEGGAQPRSGESGT